MRTALFVLLLCAVLAGCTEYCDGPLDRCVSPEVCAVAYPDDFSNMPICGPKQDGRCCPMLSRCPNGCGRRHQPTTFRSQNRESFLKYLNTSPAPGNLEFEITGVNGTEQPTAMSGIPDIAMLLEETPKLYRSADHSADDALKERKVDSDRNGTIEPEVVQKEHFATSERVHITEYSTDLSYAKNQTNESEAPKLYRSADGIEDEALKEMKVASDQNGAVEPKEAQKEHFATFERVRGTEPSTDFSEATNETNESEASKLYRSADGSEDEAPKEMKVASDQNGAVESEVVQKEHFATSERVHVTEYSTDLSYAKNQTHESEAPKLYRSADGSEDEALKEMKVASDQNGAVEPEEAQKEHFATFERVRGTEPPTDFSDATNQTNESEANDWALPRIARRHLLNMPAQVDFREKLSGSVLKLERNETGLYKKINGSTIFKRKLRAKWRRHHKKSTTAPTSNSKEDYGLEHRWFSAEAATDNFETLTTHRPKRRKRLHRLRNKGTARSIHFFESSTQSASHHLGTPQEPSSASDDFMKDIARSEDSIVNKTELNTLIINSSTVETILNFTDLTHLPSRRISRKQTSLTNTEKSLEFSIGEKTSSENGSEVTSSGTSITMKQSTLNSQSETEIQKETEQQTIVELQHRQFPSLEADSGKLNPSTVRDQYASKIQESTVINQSVTETQNATEQGNSRVLLTTSEYKKPSFLKEIPSTIYLTAESGHSEMGTQQSTMESETATEAQESTGQYSSSSNSLTTSALKYKKSPALKAVSSTKTASETQQSTINSQPVTETQQSTVSSQPLTETREQSISSDIFSTSEYGESSSRKAIESEIDSSTIDGQSLSTTQEFMIKNEPATETKISTELYVSSDSLTTSESQTVASTIKSSAVNEHSVTEIHQEPSPSGISTTSEYKTTSSLEAITNAMKSSPTNGQFLYEVQELTIKTVTESQSEQHVSNGSLTTIENEKSSFEADSRAMKSSTEDASEMEESTKKSQPITDTQNTTEQYISNETSNTSEYENSSSFESVPSVVNTSLEDGHLATEIQEPTINTETKTEPSLSSSSLILGMLYKKHPSPYAASSPKTHSTVGAESVSEIDVSTVRREAVIETRGSSEQSNSSDDFTTLEYEKLSSLRAVTNTDGFSAVDDISLSEMQELTVKNQYATKTGKSIVEHNLPTIMTTTSDANLTFSEYKNLEAVSSTTKSSTVSVHTVPEIQQSTERIEPATETPNIIEPSTSSESLTSSIVQYKKLPPVNAVSIAITPSTEGSQSEFEIQELTVNTRPVIETDGKMDSSVLLDNFTTEESLKTGSNAEKSSKFSDQNHPISSLPSFEYSTVVHPPGNVISLKSLSITLDPPLSQNSTPEPKDSKFPNLTISTVKHFTAKSIETEYTAEREQLTSAVDSVTVARDEVEFSTHSNKTELLGARKGVTVEMDNDSIASTFDFVSAFSLPMFIKTGNEKEEGEYRIQRPFPHLTSTPEETSAKRDGTGIHVTSPTTIINASTNYLAKTASENSMPLSVKGNADENSTDQYGDANLVTQTILRNHLNATTGDNSSSDGFGQRSAKLYETESGFSRKTFSGNRSDEKIHASESTGYRIVGGSVESEPWPWMVSIYRAEDMTFICGGALIESQYVLSAAHCFTGPPFKMVASVGRLERIYKVSDGTLIDLIVLHDGFEQDCYCNDLALLALKQPVDATPIGVPMHDTALVGDFTTLLGWGATAYREEGNVGTRSLQKLSRYPIHSSKDCRQIYSRLLNAELPVEFERQTLCAGIQNGSLDACLGDSGGPLMHQTKDNLWNLLGVVSFGYKCAIQGLYGTYTRISYYHDWIWKQVDAIEATKHGQKAAP